MKMIIDDEEIEEIPILNITDDYAIITIKGEHVGKRNEATPDLVKEITAIDEQNIGSQMAAKVNGVPQSSASKYGDGIDISDDDTRSRVLARKYNIADTAIAKLMETMDLINPSAIEKQVDVIRAASQLAGIVEKVSVKERGEGNQVHLHLYGPKQKALTAYEVIEVG